jgi:hypothetical protein
MTPDERIGAFLWLEEGISPIGQSVQASNVNNPSLDMFRVADVAQQINWAVTKEDQLAAITKL